MRIRLLVLLLLLLLAFGAVRAEAAGYTLDHGEVNSVRWVSERDFITTGHDAAYEERYVTWWRDGKIYREMTYTYGSSRDDLRNLSLLPLPDGSFKAVVPVTASVQPLEVHNYTADWTDAGLVNAREIPLAQAVGDRLLARVQGEEGKMAFQVLDAEGNLVYQQSFELEERYDGATPYQVGEDTFAFEFLSRDDPINDHMLVAVNREGVLLRRKLGLNVRVFGDGKGGFFVYAPQSCQNYDDGLLSHYDASGRETARKTLRGGKTVRSVRAAVYRAETDSYLLYGSAVANSRKQYDVFLLETDDALNVRSVDVRALPTEYGDYEPRFSLTPGGVSYVFIRDLTGSKKPALLTPFSALPSARDPGLSLE